MGKATSIVRASCSSSETSDEHDAVQLRHGPKSIETDAAPEPVTYENTGILNIEKNTKTRHSDSHVMSEYSNLNPDDKSGHLMGPVDSAQRKYHAKSFSLSENRIAANLNLFQQNRELWEKRTETASTHSLPAPRILSRNRIAPDLVMDLPVSNKDRAVNSSRESLNSSDDANNDGVGTSNSTAQTSRDVVNSKSIEDMTSAERFASQNQCTLKKNERFSAGAATNSESIDMPTDGKAGSSSIKPKAEIKPQESNVLKEFTKVNDSSSESSTTIAATKELASIKPGTASKDLQHKSPIPSRNTQKFVSQFADLKLTGGCLTSNSNTTAINTVADSGISQQQQQLQLAALTSFKPQVKVKPQILRKPLVLPPNASPETVRRSQD